MYDLIIIGGGPAGLAAAIEAKKSGVDRLLILERNDRLGGILQQCIHNGFGLHVFKEELTGPEYANRFIDEVESLKIPYETQTMVLDITPDKEVVAVNAQKGLMYYKAKAIILAMGCRERPRGALNIPGMRPAGIYSAGTAQKFVNIEGKMPGKKVLIVGSGDIGLIMARRMVFEGAQVEAVVELMPYSSGLKRNIVQCLNDYHIPLMLSHTVVEIYGHDRVTGATIAAVDEQLQPIKGTEAFIDCDTIFFSVGLLPENELSKKAQVTIGITGGPTVDEQMCTNQEGIFACGNVLHVHDLVDYVTAESRLAGKAAAHYVQQISSGSNSDKKIVDIQTSGGIRYTVPHHLHQGVSEPVELKFRVDKVYEDGQFVLYVDGNKLVQKKFRVASPGEMENWVIKEPYLEKLSKAEHIELALEGRK